MNSPRTMERCNYSGGGVRLECQSSRGVRGWSVGGGGVNVGRTGKRDSDLSWSSMFVSGFEGGYYHCKWYSRRSLS